MIIPILMSDTVILALIAAVSSLGAAALGVVNTFAQARLAKQAAAIQTRQTENHIETSKTLQAVATDVNGKMEKLLEVTGSSERAKGVLEGRSFSASLDRTP